MKNKQTIVPINGMDLALDESFMPDSVARFIKGWEIYINENSSAGKSGPNEGENLYMFKKKKSNKIFSNNMILPQGVNKSIGGGFVEETGMYYSFIFNNQNRHSIWQLDSKNLSVTKVLESSCLEFVYNPEFFINQIRFTYAVYSNFNKTSGVETKNTWIVFTTNRNRVKQIQVEDCIRTNGFTHSFFTSSISCCDICTLITLGYPGKPNTCIDIAPIQREDTPEERQKINNIDFKTWQFRLRYIDVWGRISVHGIMSKLYFNSGVNSCNTQDKTLNPRCLDLSMDAGCSTIACIELEYRNSDTGDWKLCDTICKYDDCDSNGIYIQDFWQRSIKADYINNPSGDIRYDSTTNTLTYRFCGNKETYLVSQEEAAIIQNYIPNKVNSVFKLGNKIGLANTERGFSPLSCSYLDKLKYSLGTSSNCSLSKKRKITIWGIIYSPLDNMVTNIRYVDKNNNGQKNTVAFGQAGKASGDFTSGEPKSNPCHYNQFFNGIDGFICYAVGHNDIYAVSKQYDISTGTPVLKGVMNGRSNSDKIIQVWDLYVDAGKYCLAFSAPSAGLNIVGDEHVYRSTSACFIGLTSLSNPGTLVSEQYELFVDCCDDNVEIKTNPVMIWDLTRHAHELVPNHANAISMNVVNSNYNLIPNTGKLGIEGATVTPINGSFAPNFHCAKSDRNGHVFGTAKGSVPGTGNQLQFQIEVPGCNNIISATNPSSGGTEYMADDLLVNEDTFEINGFVKDCVTGKPLSGQIITYQNGWYAKSDSNGAFKIYAHGLPGRMDKLVVSNESGKCYRAKCGSNGCDACFDLIDVVVPSCTTDKKVSVPDILLESIIASSQNGLMIGSYGPGIVLEDCLGMETFIQSNNTYLDVVDIDNNGIISYDFTGVVFPANFKSLSFYMTDNLTYSDWQEWIIDYAILEDNNGDIGNGVTIPNPTRVRLYIESLLYYTAYSQSNTGWQFLKGDIIEIFRLGNGDKSAIRKLVSYREGENYITIEFDADTMQTFIDNNIGSQIRILRPRYESKNQNYYQVCSKVPINNGVLSQPTGSFVFSNMFKIQRNIPKYVSQINTSDIYKNIYDTSGKLSGTKLVNATYSVSVNTGIKSTYFMNHHSASDFWGDHNIGRGRISVKNKYEKVNRFLTEISLSAGIGSNGSTNYLHWFLEQNATKFDEQVYFAINGVIVGQNLILAICSYDCFTLVYNQNEIARDPKTGQMYANTTDNLFGKPRTKIGDEFGCQQFDINTISYRNGIVAFLDSRRQAIVKHNFDSAEDVTPVGLKGWLVDKIKSNDDYNKTADNLRFFHSVICPLTDNYLLTSFEMYSAIDKYVNNLMKIDLDSNESVEINLFKKTFEKMLHFTPEMFGYIESASLGTQLLSFNNGIPWYHNPLLQNSQNVNNYYGIQCNNIMELIFNLGPNDDKNFMYIETEINEHQLYSDRIITETGQESRLMPLWWNKNNNSWAADFKCQINTVNDPNLPNSNNQNKIIDSNLLHGRWIKVRLVSKQDDYPVQCRFLSTTVAIGEVKALC